MGSEPNKIKMTYMTRVLALLFMFLIPASGGYAQSKLMIQFDVGYVLPLPDFRGDIPPEPGDNNYQMNSGIHFGAMGKYAIDKRNMFRVTASVKYSMCSNSGQISGYANSLETHKINIVTAGAGGEFAYFINKKIVPFIGAEFTANLFTGKYEYEIGDTVYNVSKLKGESRFGLLINAGVDIPLEKNMGLLLGVKYNIANLIGKNSSTGEFEITLNDEEHTVNGSRVASRSIQYLQLYAGLSFYFLQPKKK